MAGGPLCRVFYVTSRGEAPPQATRGMERNPGREVGTTGVDWASKQLQPWKTIIWGREASRDALRKALPLLHWGTGPPEQREGRLSSATME